MDLVSVVIPVFNGERFIENAIESALAQTYRKIEVLVIDDASMDHTAQIIHNRFEERLGTDVFYLRNDRNRERAFSRNRGAETAQGSYLFFLDYDDEWSEDYVRDVVKAFEVGRYDLIYSYQRTFINEKGDVLHVSKKDFGSDIGRSIFSSLVGYPTATAFRTDAFPLYREEYIPREDWEIFLRSYEGGLSIGLLDNDRVKVRSHGQRTSSHAFFWSSTLRVNDDYHDKVPGRYMADFLYHVGDVCLRFGDTPGGWRFISRAFLARPSMVLQTRKLFPFLKRGFRIDKYFRYWKDRQRLRAG